MCVYVTKSRSLSVDLFHFYRLYSRCQCSLSSSISIFRSLLSKFHSLFHSGYSVLSTTTVTGYGVAIAVGDGATTTTTQPNSNTVNRIDLNCHHHPMDGTFAIVDDAGVRGEDQDVGGKEESRFLLFNIFLTDIT